jgi:hypothetical protein
MVRHACAVSTADLVGHTVKPAVQLQRVHAQDLGRLAL